MRFWAVAAPLLLTFGCSRAAVSEPTTMPADQGTEQLEALIINDAPMVFAEGEGCPFDADSIPPLSSFDDSSLPEVDRTRSRATNMHAGNARLNDVELHEQMRPLAGQIFRCLDIAACFSEQEIGPVALEFDFELGNDGRVRAATVKPSADADSKPFLPCARMALASIEFPAYDGGHMFVNYQLSLD